MHKGSLPDIVKQDRVDFVINGPFPEIRSLLGKASVGLSTMVDEHFGINVVEFMVSRYIVEANFVRTRISVSRGHLLSARFVSLRVPA